MNNKLKYKLLALTAVLTVFICTQPVEAGWSRNWTHYNHHQRGNFGVHLGFGFGFRIPVVTIPSGYYYPSRQVVYERRTVTSDRLWEKGYAQGYRDGCRDASKYSGAYSHRRHNYDRRYLYNRAYRNGYDEGYSRGFSDRLDRGHAMKGRIR